MFDTLDRKTLTDCITPRTAKSYVRDLSYFWAWQKVANGVPDAMYPVQLEWLISFVQDHFFQIPSKDRLSKLRELGLTPTGKPLASSTLRRYLAPVSVEHILRGVTNTCRHPTFTFMMNRLDRRQENHKRILLPITFDILVKMFNACEDNIRGDRDRALLLVGFAGGGRRRSEIAMLSIEHLEKTKNGYLARLPVHKTYGFTRQPLVFPIFDQAALYMDRWLQVAGIKEGQVFRGITNHWGIRKTFTPQVVNVIIKRLAAAAGLPPLYYRAHSLRSGFISEAARLGIPLTEAMAVSGHRTVHVAMKYYFAGSILKNPASHMSSKIKKPGKVRAVDRERIARRERMKALVQSEPSARAGAP